VQGGVTVQTTTGQIAVSVLKGIFPGYVSGRWYAPMRSGGGTLVTVADTIYAHMIQVFDYVTVSQLTSRTVTGAASTNVWQGIYANVNGLPGALIAGITAMQPTATSATSTNGSFASNPVLPPGTYWLATLCSGAPGLSASVATDMVMGAFMGNNSQTFAAFTSTQIEGYSATSLFSSGLPSNFPASPTLIGSVPTVAFKVA
jgi:hypothetical protein